jgi:hypothetical protein
MYRPTAWRPERDQSRPRRRSRLCAASHPQKTRWLGGLGKRMLLRAGAIGHRTADEVVESSQVQLGRRECAARGVRDDLAITRNRRARRDLFAGWQRNRQPNERRPCRGPGEPARRGRCDPQERHAQPDAPRASMFNDALGRRYRARGLSPSRQRVVYLQARVADVPQPLMDRRVRILPQPMKSCGAEAAPSALASRSCSTGSTT